MYNLLTAIGFFVLGVSFAEAGNIGSGTYPVDVYQGDRTYKTHWMLRVDGANISGMSDWKPLYGHRQFIQPLSGTIQGTQIRIIRNCAEVEHPVCEQVYDGKIVDNQITGNWTGTGGSGSWKLFLNKPLR